MVTVPFYGSIFDFSVETFINRLEEVKLLGDPDLFVKMNTSGGDPFAGWGIITAIRDFKSEVEDATIKYRAEGMAASMGAFITLFVDGAEAIKQTHFMVHRAASRFGEGNEEMMVILDKINKDLMEAFKAKVDVQKFKQFSKVPLTRFFDSRQPRLDVNLTAKEAKAIGLIDNVVNLSPIEVKDLNTSLVAANLDPVKDTKKPKPKASVDDDDTEEDEVPKQTNSKMTVEKIQAEHPELYNAILATGKKLGVSEEKDRVEAWLAFKEIDMEAVDKGIASGKPLTQKASAYFSAAAIKSGFVEKSKGAHANLDTKGGEEEEDLGGDDEKDKKKKKFDAELAEALGLEEEAAATVE